MKLIHIALIQRPQKGRSFLFLRKVAYHVFHWYEETAPGKEVEVPVSASTTEEALRLAHHDFKNASFRTIICGFRYTLPERDEHGINALFHQMAASYQGPGGVYFDEELGHNCFVQNSSQEALQLFRQLKEQNRL